MALMYTLSISVRYCRGYLKTSFMSRWRSAYSMLTQFRSWNRLSRRRGLRWILLRQSKRANQDLELMLCCLASHNPATWSPQSCHLEPASHLGKVRPQYTSC